MTYSFNKQISTVKPLSSTYFSKSDLDKMKLNIPSDVCWFNVDARKCKYLTMFIADGMEEIFFNIIRGLKLSSSYEMITITENQHSKSDPMCNKFDLYKTALSVATNKQKENIIKFG